MVNLDRCRTLFVDVDGTIVLWPGRDPGQPVFGKYDAVTPKPNTPVIDAVLAWKKADPTKRDLIIWSGMGKAWAKRWAHFCGLFDHNVTAYLDKPYVGLPTAVIDDRVGWFDVSMRYHPEEFKKAPMPKRRAR